MDRQRESCPFCFLHQRVIRENNHAVVILSDPRKVEGHTLVIPKRHVEKPWEITDEEQIAIFELIRYVQQKLTATIAGGCDVRQHYRPYVPENAVKVNHVHYHVMPRNPEDALEISGDAGERTLFMPLTKEEFERMKDVLVRP